jgi:hypothetical protein
MKLMSFEGLAKIFEFFLLFLSRKLLELFGDDLDLHVVERVGNTVNKDQLEALDFSG